MAPLTNWTGLLPYPDEAEEPLTWRQEAHLCRPHHLRIRNTRIPNTKGDDMAEQTITPDKQNVGRLSGPLGVPAIVFMVVAAAAPLTVIGGGCPLAALLGNGAGAPAMFAIGGAILLLFAVGLATMTASSPSPAPSSPRRLRTGTPGGAGRCLDRDPHLRHRPGLRATASSG